MRLHTTTSSWALRTSKYSLSGQPVPVLNCPHREKQFCYIQVGSPLFQLLITISHSCTIYMNKKPGSSASISSEVLERCPPKPSQFLNFSRSCLDESSPTWDLSKFRLNAKFKTSSLRVYLRLLAETQEHSICPT